jgi:hypothetical protein
MKHTHTHTHTKKGTERHPCLALVVQAFGESDDYARLPGAEVPEKHLQTIQASMRRELRWKKK